MVLLRITSEDYRDFQTAKFSKDLFAPWWRTLGSWWKIPLNQSQWDFYMLETKILNEQKPTQQRISLSSLLKLDPVRVSFGGLKEAIEQMAESIDR